jgi:hypothetical protein
MPWAYIAELLGPGLHWGRAQQELGIAAKKHPARGGVKRTEAEEMRLRDNPSSMAT